MANDDSKAYQAGRAAYGRGEKPPSMRPSGMPEAAWREWVKGWEDAASDHAEDEARRKDDAEGLE